MKNTLNEFIDKLLNDIHNIDPELSLKRQTEYNKNFVNKVLNEAIDFTDSSLLLNNGLRKEDGVYYKGQKHKIITVDEQKQIASLQHDSLPLISYNVPFNKLQKIVL